jgi:hypothetical protein
MKPEAQNRLLKDIIEIIELGTTHKGFADTELSLKIFLKL